MKLIALIVGAVICCSSCENDNIELDYCKMLELDQSYVNSGETCVDLLNLYQKKRNVIFKNNFNEIIEYSKQNGFPEMGSLKTSGLDSCRNWTVMITLFHVGQTQPKLFFEEESVKILSKEIEAGRLRSKSLYYPFRESFRYHEFCESDKDRIYEVLKLLKQDINELPMINFKECEE